VFPASRWLARTSTDSLKADALAGLTNAAIVLPQGVAFAIIAGLPPEYGLYTAMIVPVIAALWGSSMVMVSGPTTAISALVFATLAEVATPGTPRFVELALLLTVLVSLFQVCAALAHLGGLVSFVSHSVIVAFTAAAAVLIAVSQVPAALGLTVDSGGNVVERITVVAESLPGANGAAVMIAGATLMTVAVSQRVFPRAPGFLIALFAGTGMASLIDAEARGVAMLAPISSPLPHFTPPYLSWDDIALRIAPVAQKLGRLQGLLCPQRRAGKRHLGVTARRRRAVCRLERKRHLRPRPLGSCHGVLLGLSGSGQRVGHGIVQHHRDHGGLKADRAFNRQIDGLRGFSLDPIAEPAQRPVSGERRADAGTDGVKRRVAVGALGHCLDFGPVLVVVGERRQRHLGLPRLAVAQDQQAVGRDALGQHLTAQCGRWQCR
jgi:hypothetical protein